MANDQGLETRIEIDGGVTDKNDTVMYKPVHLAALECVDTDPLKIKFEIITHHCVDTPGHVFRFEFFFPVDIPTQLEIQAPDIIGLFMQ